MTKAPYMPLYVKDAWTDEKFLLLPWDAQGLFWRLAAMQWLEGSIPADVKAVIDLVGKPQATRRLWPTMREFFVPTEAGRLQNARLEEIRADVTTNRSNSRKGADAANEKRWGQRQESDSKSDASSDKKKSRPNIAPRVAGEGVSAIGSSFSSLEEREKPFLPEDGLEAVDVIRRTLAHVAPRMQTDETEIALWLRDISPDPWWISAALCEAEKSMQGARTGAYAASTLRRLRDEGWTCEGAQGYVEHRWRKVSA